MLNQALSCYKSTLVDLVILIPALGRRKQGGNFLSHSLFEAMRACMCMGCLQLCEILSYEQLYQEWRESNKISCHSQNKP